MARNSLVVAAVAFMALAACAEPMNPLIAQGRTGGPVPNEQCEWSLFSLSQYRGGVWLQSEAADGGGTNLNVVPEGDDDVVWLNVLTFCVDAPTFVVGGVSPDVASVVLTSQRSDQVVLDVLDVPDSTSGAVIGELPRSWRADDSFHVEAISRHDGAVLVEESYPDLDSDGTRGN